MIVNLCFHGIGVCATEREAGESRYWVSTKMFPRILDEVVGRADVRLSFDDGNRSDVDIALPTLQERGLTAEFFALAGRLDDSASLGPEDLLALRAGGMAIGSHGWDHIPWRGLSHAEVRHELVDARLALGEASNGVIQDAALPLGRYDRALLAQLRDADYRTVFTSDRFPARADAWLQARYSVTSTDSVDSVRDTLTRHVSLREARNLAASVIKRFR